MGVERDDQRSDIGGGSSRGECNDNVSNTNHSSTYRDRYSNNTADLYMSSSLETKWVFLEQKEVGDETKKR